MHMHKWYGKKYGIERFGINYSICTLCLNVIVLFKVMPYMSEYDGIA